MTNDVLRMAAAAPDPAPPRFEPVAPPSVVPSSVVCALTERAHDAELVRRAKAGELPAFESLVTRHQRRLYTLARRITKNEQDAEDVTQQTFLSALENLADFRGDASFSTWLLRIATHAALKVLRKRHGLPTVSLEENTELQDGRETVPHPEYLIDQRELPEHLVDRNETRRLVESALNRLDDKHRLVFVLRDIEGLSVRETADALGLSEGNVKIRLLRARLQLREHLSPAYGALFLGLKIS